jgi:hypothetical protein
MYNDSVLGLKTAMKANNSQHLNCILRIYKDYINETDRYLLMETEPYFMVGWGWSHTTLDKFDVIYWDDPWVHDKEDRDLFRTARNMGIRQVMATTPRDDKVNKFFDKNPKDFELKRLPNMRSV